MLLTRNWLRWKQPKGEDRTKMKEEAKLLRCTLLNVSGWSTERRYMRRYNGKCDIFFGKELRGRRKWRNSSIKRLMKDEGLQRMQRELLMETTGSEDRKHMSGGVFVAVDSNLGAVVGAEEGSD